MYAPYTGALLGVAALDFVLKDAGDLVNTVVSASEAKFAYILDGKSNLMVSASIAGISTSPDGQVNVLDCGVPEIEVGFSACNSSFSEFGCNNLGVDASDRNETRRLIQAPSTSQLTMVHLPLGDCTLCT